jgi:hypothetical protein
MTDGIRPTFLCFTWVHMRRFIRKGTIRVYHWHVPRRDIVNCENVKDLAAGLND